MLELMPTQMARAADDIKVRNVSFRLIGTRIAVNYDIEGPESGIYRTRLTLRRESDTTFIFIPRMVTGDIGEGVYGGTNKQINWDFLTEFPGGLEGSDYYFVVEAEVFSPSSNIYYWIAGVVAVGGAAAAYLLGKKASTTTDNSTAGFPAPVGRPTGN
jgi:hypothetical protein